MNVTFTSDPLGYICEKLNQFERFMDRTARLAELAQKYPKEYARLEKQLYEKTAQDVVTWITKPKHKAIKGPYILPNNPFPDIRVYHITIPKSQRLRKKKYRKI